MIRDDRQLLAELARLNGDMVSLGMRIIDGSASAAAQADYALRLIAAGERLRRRADEMNHTVIDGEPARGVTGTGIPALQASSGTSD